MQLTMSSCKQVTEGAKESPLHMSGATTQEVQAVVAFSARYFSGGPFQNPVRVLLKVCLQCIPRHVEY